MNYSHTRIMNHQNTEFATKQDMQNMKNEIITELKDFMMDGFRKMHEHMTLIETDHGRRLKTVEYRTDIIKDVLEKDLDTKVAW